MHYTFTLYACIATTAASGVFYRLLSALDHWIWKSSTTHEWNLVRELKVYTFGPANLTS